MLLSLLCVSSSAIADFSDRAMGERYRNRHKDMDICAEIKEDLFEAEEAYNNFAKKVRAANTAIDAQRRTVNAKESTLSNLQSRFNQANSTYTSLSNKQKRNYHQLL